VPGSINPVNMAHGVETLLVDSSGSIVALNSLGPGPNGPVGQLLLFAAGSDKPQPMGPVQNPEPGQHPGAPVSSFTLDGSGSVVALINPTSMDTYALVRFAPGSTSPVQLDASASSFVIDGTGAVIVLDNGALKRFAVGSITAQAMPLSGPVTSYLVDGSGSVFAVSDQVLWLFPLGSATAKQVAGGSGNTSGQFAGTVSQVAVDGSGEVIALVGGDLVRFAISGTSATSICPSTQHFVVDSTGSVYALTNGLVEFFIPGSRSGQESQYLANVTELLVDGAGTVVALSTGASSGGSDTLYAFLPGSPENYVVVSNSTAFGTEGGGWFEGYVIQIAVDASGSLVALVSPTTTPDVAPNNVTYYPGSFLVRFAPGLAYGTASFMSSTTNTETFFEDDEGDIVAAVVANPRASDLSYMLVDFSPGSTDGVPVTDAKGNVINTISDFVVDNSGAIFAAYDGQNTFTSGAASASPVYSLVRIAPGTTVGVPVDGSGGAIENVSNLGIEWDGSVIVLDAYSQTLYRIGSGTSSATSIDYDGDPVTAFGIVGAGDVVAMESYNSGKDFALIQYTTGEPSGSIIDTLVQYFAFENGNVLALDDQGGVGSVVLFTAGSPTRHVLDANSVTQIALLPTGEVAALQMPNPSSKEGTLVLISPIVGGGITSLDSTPVSGFFVDRYGVVIAVENLESQGFAFDDLISYNNLPQSDTPNVIVDTLLELSVLPDGTMLALSLEASSGGPGNHLFAYSPGTYSNSMDMTPIANNMLSFSVASGVQTFEEWLADESSELKSYPPPPSIWQSIAEFVEVIGSLVATYFTAGAASPLVIAAVGAGDALLDQTINHFAFGTSFNLGSIGLGALGSALGGDDGILDTLDDLGDNVGGVVGDFTDALDDAAGEISDTVGDVVGSVIDPDSFVGQALENSFNSAITTLISTGSLGQAANAALSSLKNSAEDGLLNSSFAQDTLSFVDSVTASGQDLFQDGLEQLNEIASDGLAGSEFGQTVASFLVNAVQNGVTGQPIFQNSLSFLGQVISDGLGDSPFGQEAAQLVSQALTNGVNLNLVSNLVSFLGQTAADGLANSSFVQDGLSFLNQVFASGFGGSSLLQDGVNFLETTVANGLAGSNFSQQVGAFLQEAGVDGLNTLGSTVTGEIGTFLQEVTQEGTAFADSTLGGDVGAFLQQAGQDGASFLNSTFVTGAGSVLDQAVLQINTLGATTQANLGDLLEDAAQNGGSFVNSLLGQEAGSFLQTAAQDGMNFLDSSFMSGASAVLEDAAQQISSLGTDVQSTLGEFLQEAATAGSEFLGSTLGGDIANFLITAAQDGVSFLNSSFVGDSSWLLYGAIKQVNSLGSAVQSDLGKFLQDAAHAGVDFANSTLGTDVGTFFGSATPSLFNSAFFSGASAVLDDAVLQFSSLSSTVQTDLGGFLQDAAEAGTGFLNSTLGGDVANFLGTAAQDGFNFVNSSFVAGAGALLQEATQQLAYMGSTAQASIGTFLEDAAQAGTTFANSTLGTDAAGFLNTAAQDGAIFLNSGLVSGASSVLGAAAQQIGSLVPAAQADLGSFLQDAAAAENAFAGSTLGGDVANFLSAAAQDGVSFLNSSFVAGANSLLGEAAQQINSLGFTAQADLGGFLQGAAQVGASFANSTLGTAIGGFLITATQDGANFLNSSFLARASFLLQEATQMISFLGSAVQTNLGLKQARFWPCIFSQRLFVGVRTTIRRAEWPQFNSV
jgi:hypothetical protein